MTENEARTAFKAAQIKLDAAMSEYRKAGAALQKFTGENHATDQSVSLRFNAAAGAAAGAAPGAYKADC